MLSALGPQVSVVDDDESVRKSLARLIRSAGISVNTYSSGQDLLDALETAPPKCLLLDVRMPGMGGLEIQRRLAETSLDLPIIFISAHEDEEVRAQAIEAGAIAFLFKPFDEQELMSAIQSALAETEHPKSECPKGAD